MLLRSQKTHFYGLHIVLSINHLLRTLKKENNNVQIPICTTNNNFIPNDNNCNEVAHILTKFSISSNQSKGGRPKDSVNKKKNYISIATNTFINEVTAKYAEEKKKYNSPLEKGQFDKIVKELRLLSNIDKNVTISKAIVYRHIQYRNLVISSSSGRKQSSLLQCKSYFVDMIIKLAYYRNSITCTKGLLLINSLIKNTEI